MKRPISFSHYGFFALIRTWLESVEIQDPKIARIICKWIPSQCPFARTVKLLNFTIVQIPPLCKLNPFYEQIMQIRFRSLSYLADQCGEDVSLYC
ncbi:MAG: Mo-dependent nitrogenase C-terminal domain-containing protein [Leptolyngbyaceae cyanobacterium]